MIFLVPLVILSSVYIASNKNVKESSKVGFFAILLIIAVLYILFGVILG